MGDNHNAEPISFILSAVFAFFAFITINDVKSWLTIVSALFAIVCGGLGAYNHWLAIKEKRKNGL